MKSDINMPKSCHDPQPSGSDNEKTSTYSSKDDSCHYDQIFSGPTKSEYQTFSKHYSTNNIEDQTSQQSLDLTNSLKVEQTMSSPNNSEIEMFGSRRRQLFKCGICPKVFSNSSAIAKHKLTHSDERKYACDTCGKTFKRQDHLNGHKHTHNTNKPHACRLCDRSYSDARSLRRHYENQHQNEVLRCKEQKVGRDSCGSSVDEPCSSEVFGFLDDRKCIKCDVCSKAFKNQSALNGHMRLHGGYGQAKNGITGPGEVRPLASVISGYSPEKSNSSELVSSTRMDHSPGPLLSSTRLPKLMIITSMPIEVTQSQLHSLLSMVPSKPSMAQHTTGQGFNHRRSAISSAVLDKNHLPNLNMDDLCMCLSPSSNSNPLPTSCAMVEASNSSSLNNNPSDTIMNTSDAHHNHYSPITPAFINQTTSTSISNSRIFNYPSMVTSHNLSYNPGNQDPYQYNWDNTHSPYISTNSNCLERPLSYFDLPSSDVPDNKSSNPSSLPQISSSNNLQDFMNLDFIDPCNNLDSDWCKNYYENEDTNMIAESSETDSIVKKEMSTDLVMANQSCSYSQSNIIENPPSPLYKQSPKSNSSMVMVHRRNKSRPGPIFIPPQTSAHMSKLRSPRVWNTGERKETNIPPYTPPPMLSPQRKGPGLFHSVWNTNGRLSGNISNGICPWSASFVNNSITTMANGHFNDSVVSTSCLGNHQISSETIYSPVNHQMSPMWFKEHENPITLLKRNVEPEHFLYHEDSLDYQPNSVDDSDGLPTSATPRINIGSQYQAQLPPYSYDKINSRDDKREILLWDPKQFKETVENISSLDLLMKIASSPAVKSCGLNMEYTFHLLCKFKGDLEKTLQALLEDSFVVYDYVYAETTNWTTDEINKFQERLKKHDRDFMQVALDLQSCGMNKSVKACVEFYYVWKQMNNVKEINRFLIKSSRKKLTRYEDSCPANNDEVSLAQSVVDSGYNLRKRFPSDNQKAFNPYHPYGLKSSSDSSSLDSSPVHCKSQRSMAAATEQRVKVKSRSYACSQCKRKFVKSKALENHMRSHNGSTNIIREKRSLR